ncbi:unnamed protein product [Amoebophrya sp. A120]|nr:unnamed protein product [Amoebophrya sp. A120]|eukprot:GSA120T00016811001.1
MPSFRFMLIFLQWVVKERFFELSFVRSKIIPSRSTVDGDVSVPQFTANLSKNSAFQAHYKQLSKKEGEVAEADMMIAFVETLYRKLITYVNTTVLSVVDHHAGPRDSLLRPEDFLSRFALLVQNQQIQQPVVFAPSIQPFPPMYQGRNPWVGAFGGTGVVGAATSPLREHRSVRLAEVRQSLWSWDPWLPPDNRTSFKYYNPKLFFSAFHDEAYRLEQAYQNETSSAAGCTEVPSPSTTGAESPSRRGLNLSAPVFVPGAPCEGALTSGAFGPGGGFVGSVAGGTGGGACVGNSGIFCGSPPLGGVVPQQGGASPSSFALPSSLPLLVHQRTTTTAPVPSSTSTSTPPTGSYIYTAPAPHRQKSRPSRTSNSSFSGPGLFLPSSQPPVYAAPSVVDLPPAPYIPSQEDNRHGKIFGTPADVLSPCDVVQHTTSTFAEQLVTAKPHDSRHNSEGSSCSVTTPSGGHSRSSPATTAQVATTGGAAASSSTAAPLPLPPPRRSVNKLQNRAYNPKADRPRTCSEDAGGVDVVPAPEVAPAAEAEQTEREAGIVGKADDGTLLQGGGGSRSSSRTSIRRRATSRPAATRRSRSPNNRPTTSGRTEELTLVQQQQSPPWPAAQEVVHLDVGSRRPSGGTIFGSSQEEEPVVSTSQLNHAAGGTSSASPSPPYLLSGTTRNVPAPEVLEEDHSQENTLVRRVGNVINEFVPSLPSALVSNWSWSPQ